MPRLQALAAIGYAATTRIDVAIHRKCSCAHVDPQRGHDDLHEAGRGSAEERGLDTAFILQLAAESISCIADTCWHPDSWAVVQQADGCLATFLRRKA